MTFDPIRREKCDAFFQKAIAFVSAGIIGKQGPASPILKSATTSLVEDTLFAYSHRNNCVPADLIENIYRLHQWIPMYGHFYALGRNIIELTSESCDFLSKVDVCYDSLAEVELPFDSVYLHFGLREELKIELSDGWGNEDVSIGHITGAYLSKYRTKYGDPVLIMGLATCERGGTLIPTNGPIAKFTSEVMNYPIEKAVTRVLLSEMASLNKNIHISEPERLIFKQLTEKKIKAVGSAMHLVLNCLGYIESITDISKFKHGNEGNVYKVNYGLSESVISPPSELEFSQWENNQEMSRPFSFSDSDRIEKRNLERSEGIRWIVWSLTDTMCKVVKHSNVVLNGVKLDESVTLTSAVDFVVDALLNDYTERFIEVCTNCFYSRDKTEGMVDTPVKGLYRSKNMTDYMGPHVLISLATNFPVDLQVEIIEIDSHFYVCKDGLFLDFNDLYSGQEMAFSKTIFHDYQVKEHKELLRGNVVIEMCGSTYRFPGKTWTDIMKTVLTELYLKFGDCVLGMSLLSPYKTLEHSRDNGSIDIKYVGIGSANCMNVIKKLVGYTGEPITVEFQMDGFVANRFELIPERMEFKGVATINREIRALIKNRGSNK
tara:strand:+ start:236 stop:2044 length:1809 start_codon:yes stop_codon:yes gene_type:complete